MMRAWRIGLPAIVATIVVFSTGCLRERRDPVPPMEGVPKELTKVTLPEHMIEPPDILTVDLIAAVPKPPYKLQPLDTLSMRAMNVDPNEPIQGLYQVDPDGTISVGSYGKVKIVGMTTDEARLAILEMIKKTWTAPTLNVVLAGTRGMQQVRGPHLVRPDGTLWFDIYGGVRVVGMTLPQAQQAIEEHLSQFFLEPKVALNITGYNSKVFYMIFDSPYGGASQMLRLPVTGNDTVLDAFAQAGGLSQIADYKRIWVARPAPVGSCPQILPVDIKAITEKADVATNYQLLPGDRIFVKSAPFVTFAARLDRVLAPFERLIGFGLLLQSAALNRQDLNNGTGTGR